MYIQTIYVHTHAHILTYICMCLRQKVKTILKEHANKPENLRLLRNNKQLKIDNLATKHTETQLHTYCCT